MAVMPKYYKIHTDGCTVELEPIYTELAPVVRCGQCKHWKTADDHCTNPAGLCATGKKARNNYCIFGERKDGEG